MIIHSGRGVPAFLEAWDPQDKEFVWVAWDDVLDGATLTASTWQLPSGWTNHAEQTNASVSDDEGSTFEAANAVLLSTTARRGAHVITNRVVLSDERVYERSVRITVKSL